MKLTNKLSLNIDLKVLICQKKLTYYQAKNCV